MMTQTQRELERARIRQHAFEQARDALDICRDLDEAKAALRLRASMAAKRVRDMEKKPA